MTAKYRFACYNCITELPRAEESYSLGLDCVSMGSTADQTMSKTRAHTDTNTATAENSAASTEALAPELLTPEQIDDLKTRAGRADENWERLLRATADLDNYKKRTQREREDAVKFANESLMKKLIPVLDNFEMALSAANQTPAAANAQSLQTGVAMILQQLRSALTESGLEEVDATGKAFDPNFHEAVAQQESAEVPDGHVLQQMRKGYKLRDRLIRPATVVVAKKPAA
jgi:molecular chaperone GrpE